MKQSANCYPCLTFLLFGLAVILRLLLCSQNPPTNSFDDHYEPVSLIMKTGEIPRKDACFECYNPPVFYSIAAVTANALRSLGLSVDTVQKALQFQNCFYNILTLLIVYMILKKFSNLTEFSRLFAFGTVCFLPRHIYMAAMFSNDNLGYLGVAVCTYLMLVTLERREPWWLFAVLLGMAASLTVFVKYTGFVVLPMIAIAYLTLAARKAEERRSRPFAMMFIALLPPLFLLGSYMVTNYKDYGDLLPWNEKFLDTSKIQPRDDEQLNFFSFTPWQYIREPVQVPGQLHSFWTLIYTNAWFDTEPKFLHYTDWDKGWWSQYWTWRRGESTFPAAQIPLSTLTRTFAVGLLTFGLIPLFLLLAGMIGSIHKFSTGTDNCVTIEKCLPLLILLAGNAALVIWLTLKAPVFSSMKASYLLGSLPAFGVFIAQGAQLFEGRCWWRYIISFALIMLVLFTSLHVMRIAWSIKSWSYL
jgi:hypothetical protein